MLQDALPMMTVARETVPVVHYVILRWERVLVIMSFIFILSLLFQFLNKGFFIPILFINQRLRPSGKHVRVMYTPSNPTFI